MMRVGTKVGERAFKWVVPCYNAKTNKFEGFISNKEIVKPIIYIGKDTEGMAKFEIKDKEKAKEHAMLEIEKKLIKLFEDGQYLPVRYNEKGKYGVALTYPEYKRLSKSLKITDCVQLISVCRSNNCMR